MLSGIIGGTCHKYHFCRHKHMFVAKHVFVATKHVFCRDKTRLLSRQNTSFVATKICLSRQNYACRYKHVVATNIILSRQNFCRYKHTFVATNTCLSWHSKIMFLATYNCDKYLSQKAILFSLSRQAYFCGDKHVFVVTKICLLQQNFCTVQNVLSRQAYF